MVFLFICHVNLASAGTMSSIPGLSYTATHVWRDFSASLDVLPSKSEYVVSYCFLISLTRWKYCLISSPLSLVLVALPSVKNLLARTCSKTSSAGYHFSLTFHLCISCLTKVSQHEVNKPFRLGSIMRKNELPQYD